MAFVESIKKSSANIGQNAFMKTIKDAFVMELPILLSGVLAKIIATVAVICGCASDGVLVSLLNVVIMASLGFLSVYTAFFIAFSVLRNKEKSTYFCALGGGASALSLIILNSSSLFPMGMGTESLLIAILTGWFSALLAIFVDNLLHRSKLGMDGGSDIGLNRAFEILIPAVSDLLVFTLIRFCITAFCSVESLYELLDGFFAVVLKNTAGDFLSGLWGTAFISLSNFLGLDLSQSALSYCSETLLFAPFVRVALLGGGCGVLGLALTSILFSKDKSVTRVGIISIFASLFNIGVPALTAFPILLNPVMFLPALFAPVLCWCLAFLVNHLSWVNFSVYSMENPWVFSSWKEVVFLLVCVVLSAAVYFPFLKLLESQRNEEYHKNYEDLVAYYKKVMGSFNGGRLIELNNGYGDMARSLADDLKLSLPKKQIQIRYQPQYAFDGKCVGVEAFMRWEHPVYGMVFPPIVFELATETGVLEELEEYIFTTALECRSAVYEKFGKGIRLCLNVTGTSIAKRSFLDFMRDYDRRHGLKGKNVCFEIAEQATFSFNEAVLNNFNAMKEMGVKFAIDDFSVGQGSVNYLKENLFDLVKLDGSVVRGIEKDQRSKNVASNVIGFAESLGVTVLAQNVETTAQRDVLNKMGCKEFQGYLYSPAIAISSRK